jgi:hypothetical protein
MTYRLEYVGGAAPTQAWGRTGDNRPFYFRARRGEWTLEVGERGWPTFYADWPRDYPTPGRWDPVTEPPGMVASGWDETHGFMEPFDVEAILNRHLGGPAIRSDT